MSQQSFQPTTDIANKKNKNRRKQELHPRTAVLNKKDKNRSRLARLQALSWLAEKFPHAFDNTLRIRPLKTGIMEDVMAHAEEAVAAGISRSKLREAVVVFTRRVDYLTCLKARETRVDLQGNPCNEVSEEEAERAANKIRKRVEKSARNARKLMAGKTVAYYPRTEKPAMQDHDRAGNETQYDRRSRFETAKAPNAPYFPDRSPAFSSQNAAAAPRSAASVVVKHKPSRSYDPDAVARLKAKLGLSRNNDKVATESENRD